MIEGIEIAGLLACPACGFDPNSEFTAAANLAIGFMVFVLAGVLGGFLLFMRRMAKMERAAHAGGAMSPLSDGPDRQARIQF